MQYADLTHAQEWRSARAAGCSHAVARFGQLEDTPRATGLETGSVESQQRAGSRRCRMPRHPHVHAR